MTTIPKVIHYCWFGRNPLPPLAEKCIASWRKYLPDYEIKEWNEDNFDVNIVTYTSEAYHAKKYAFVSDYARFWILYHHGGIYFDVDVEVIKPIDDILERGPFAGLEDVGTPLCGKVAGVAAGLGLASYPRLPLFGKVLEYYNSEHFITRKGKFNEMTVVYILTSLLSERTNVDVDNISVSDGLYIYPRDYFDPMVFQTKEIVLTENTRCIHHYAGSWVDRKRQRGIKMHWKRLKNRLLRFRLKLQRKRAQ